MCGDRQKKSCLKRVEGFFSGGGEVVTTNQVPRKIEWKEEVQEKTNSVVHNKKMHEVMRISKNVREW